MLNVLISLITDDNDFQLAQAAAAQAAADRHGIGLQIIYAGNDAVVQTQQILSFIQNPGKKPDAILAEPVGTGMPQIAKAAVSAGIAWGILNSDVDYVADLRLRASVPIFCILSDHEMIGKIQGQQIAALLGDRGCVLHIEGPSVRDVTRLRTKGMMATKPTNVTVKTLKGDWTQNSGFHAVRSWLSLSTSKQLHVGMIACQNDDMAIGARRAFAEIVDSEERDAWLSLPVTGCDGVTKSGQEWVRQGKLAATVVAPTLAGNAIDLLVTSLKAGTKPPDRTVLAPSSFPPLDKLQRARGARAQ